ncbi:MAG: hypothetical protein NTX23_05270 [Candidatus Bipolaricaulota bacterium]|nr:hypothetical protein [Candidatus Bipolaricaulota bacterium]
MSVARGAIEAALLPGTLRTRRAVRGAGDAHEIPVEVILAETTPLHDRRVIG